MNKRSMVGIIFVLMVVLSSRAMEDKPALGTGARIAKGVSKVYGGLQGINVGAGVGYLGGALGGGMAGGVAGAVAGDIPVGAAVGSTGGAVFGGLAGVPIGGYYGWKVGDVIANFILSRIHDVTYRIEKISQFYDINLDQYARLLVTASMGTADEVNKVLSDLYTRRFGKNWRNRLANLFDSYAPQIDSLQNQNRNYLTDDERDFLRMVDLGAAASNLYFDTSPNKENMLLDALKLYDKLGLVELK